MRARIYITRELLFGFIASQRMSNTNGQSVKTIMAWFWARQVSKDLRNEHTTNLKIDFRRLLTLIGMIPRKRGHVRTILRLENVTPI